MTTGMTFSGGKEIEARLRDLGGKVAGRLGGNAACAGARLLAREAKARAPVRTGALRDSITTRGERSRGGTVRQAHVVVGVRYGLIVEVGTAHQPARSYLRKAADEEGQAVVDQAGKNLWTGINRETAKLGRIR